MLALALALMLLTPDMHRLTSMAPGVYEVRVGAYVTVAETTTGVLSFTAPPGTVEVKLASGPQANGCAARERSE